MDDNVLRILQLLVVDTRYYRERAIRNEDKKC